MKMDCLILGIFLINSVVNMPEYNTMTLNDQQNFTDLKMGEKYYFTISNSRNIKYSFKIKILSAEFSSSTSISMSYIGHYSKDISSKKEEGNLTLSFSIDNNYNTYESSSCFADYYISKYITFILISKYDIDLASFMICEANSGISFGITYLIVFSSLLAFFILVISSIGFIKRGCIIIDHKKEGFPQPENYTSLTSQQNQQPQPQNTDLLQNANEYPYDQY